MIFYLMGLPRSGHHAVAIWLACQSPQERDFQMVEENSRHYVSRDILMVRLSQYPRLQDIWTDERVQEYLENGRPIILHDNGPPWDLRRYNARAVSLQGSVTVPVAPIVVVRTFANNYASVLRNPATNRHRESFVPVWKRHARQVLNDGGIVYDRWFVERSYRQQICERLRLTFTDRGLEYVNTAGGGSSFDGRSYDGQAQKMDVRLRVQGSEEVLRVLREDSELERLSHRLLNG